MIEQALSVVSPLIGAGLVLVFMRLWTAQLGRMVETIVKRMDCFEHSQHACQLQNAREYATWEQHNLLSDKVDRMDTRLTRVESKSDRQQ